MHKLSDFCSIYNIKFPNFTTFQTNDWKIRVNKTQQTIQFELIKSDLKPTTIPITGKFERDLTCRNSIFYDNGTLIENDVIYFQNYQTICKIFRNHKTNQLFVLHDKSTCCCGKSLNISNPETLFFCARFPNCHMVKCLDCAQSSDEYRQLCFDHHVEKSSECKDYTFKIIKDGETVTVDIGYQKLSFNVDEIKASSSERLQILNVPNNFYYDCGIMNLHMKNGQITPFAFVLFDKDEQENKFGTQSYSTTHDESMKKILKRWNKYWKQIIQNKKQNYNFLNFVNRINLHTISVSESLSESLSTNLESHGEISVRSQDKMPLFHSLPVLMFGGWMIFNSNSTALNNPTIKEPTIIAHKGNCKVSCNLWSGALRTDYFSCFTNSQGDRELWINNHLVMKNMQLVGFNYN